MAIKRQFPREDGEGERGGIKIRVTSLVVWAAAAAEAAAAAAVAQESFLVVFLPFFLSWSIAGRPFEVPNLER